MVECSQLLGRVLDQQGSLQGFAQSRFDLFKTFLILFGFNCCFSFHLLFNFQHLELSFGLSSLEFVLSLHSGEVSFSGGFLGGSGFGLLDGLGSEEFLLLLFSLEFLLGFFFLKLFELSSSFFRENFFLLSFLLGISNFGLEFDVLLEFSFSLLLLIGKLVKKCFLLSFLLCLKLLKGLVLQTRFGCTCSLS